MMAQKSAKKSIILWNQKKIPPKSHVFSCKKHKYGDNSTLTFLFRVTEICDNDSTISTKIYISRISEFPPHPCFQAVEAGEMLGYPLMWIYFSEKRMIREAAEAAKPRPPPPSQETWDRIHWKATLGNIFDGNQARRYSPLSKVSNLQWSQWKLFRFPAIMVGNFPFPVV